MMSLIIFIFVAFLASKNAQNTSNLDSLDYIFYVTSDDVEDATVKLFNILKLPLNSFNTKAIQKELNMYTYLKVTTNINYKIFRDIVHISHNAYDNDKSNNVSTDNAINEIINGTLNDENAQESILEVFHHFIPLITRKIDPEDSDDLSLEFVKEFIDKLSNTELKDSPDDSSLRNDPNDIVNIDMLLDVKENNYENNSSTLTKNGTQYSYETNKEKINGTFFLEYVSSNEASENFTDSIKTNNSFDFDFTQDISNSTPENLSDSKENTEHFEGVAQMSKSVTNSSKDNMQNTESFNYTDIRPLSNRRMEPWDPNSKYPDYWLRTRRIFRGRKANIRSYPFMVSVHDEDRFLCGASIIRNNLAVSAASCLERIYLDFRNKNSITPIYLRVGSNHAKSGGYMVHASHIMFHPDFDPVTMSNNLVLLYVRIGDFTKFPWVKRINLKKEESLFGDTRPGRDRVKVLGWGEQANELNNINNNKSKEPPLTSDHLDIFSLQECRSIYTSVYVTEQNFCAGYLHIGGGACKNDVGGPGIRHGLLLGVVSFGPTQCGEPNKPTVFTRITPYVTWISDVIHNILPKIKPPPPKFYYNETWDEQTRRRATYIHKIPETIKQSQNIVKLRTRRRVVSRKRIIPEKVFNSRHYTEDRHGSLNTHEDYKTSRISRKIRKNRYTGRDLLMELEITPKTFLLPFENSENIPRTTRSRKTTTVVDKIFLLEEQDSSDTEEKDPDQNEGIVIKYNDPILDYRPDISISSEGQKNETSLSAEETTTKRKKNRFNTIETTEYSTTQTQRKKHHNKHTIHSTPKSVDQSKSENTEPVTGQFILVSSNINITNCKTKHVNHFDTTPIAVTLPPPKKQIISDKNFILLNIYEDYDYDITTSAPNNTTPNVTVDNTVAGPEIIVLPDINYDDDSIKYYINDTDDDDNNKGENESSYSVDENLEYGGLSIEPLGRLVVTSEPPLVDKTKYRNISGFVTAFNMNNPARIRFESIRKRDFGNEKDKFEESIKTNERRH